MPVWPGDDPHVKTSGKSQKADGLTKALADALLKTFVSDLGLAALTFLSSHHFGVKLVGGRSPHTDQH